MAPGPTGKDQRPISQAISVLLLGSESSAGHRSRFGALPGCPRRSNSGVPGWSARSPKAKPRARRLWGEARRPEIVDADLDRVDEGYQAATPPAIVDRLGGEINRALADDEVKKKLLVQGLEARPGSAAEFGKFIDEQTQKWSALIQEAGLKGE